MNNKISKQKAYLIPAIIMIVLGIILFVPAGTFLYWQAWIFWAGFTFLTFLIPVYFLKKNPDFLARRTDLKEKEPTRKVPSILNLFFIGYILPGLDFRFNWSEVPFWLVIISNILVFLGYLLVIFVFRENSFASPVINVEKEQQVITTGPYSVVRHPMYLGLLVMFLFTSLALGSFWAVIPFLLTIPMNILRIKYEEELLLKDLTGYKAYCLKTRYRLIPFIW